MKLNWGASIVIAIVSFMAFILYFVVQMSTNKDLEHDLVTEEYYKKEIDFQQQLNKEINAQKLVTNIRIERTAEGVLVLFPEELDFTRIEGKLFLYRPSNKQLDKEIALSLTSHQMLVPQKQLLGGRWNIEIDWKHGEESYFYKKELTL